jgi:putative PIN family toxin of toxin-antitoxin system
VKVVLDTNVFISGILFRGPPYQALEAWCDGAIQLVVSEKILEEYLRVGEILSKQFPKIRLNPIFELLTIEAEIVAGIKLPKPVCIDPEDDKFLECAIVGKADVLVSGDKHLLNVSGYCGIEVVTPRKFIDRFINNVTK